MPPPPPPPPPAGGAFGKFLGLRAPPDGAQGGCGGRQCRGGEGLRLQWLRLQGLWLQGSLRDMKRGQCGLAGASGLQLLWCCCFALRTAQQDSLGPQASENPQSHPCTH
jgi:hypothetical protein